MTEPLIGVKEQARQLGVKKSWIYARTRETGPDAMPRLKLGKYLRFDPKQVMAWVKRQNQTKAAE